MKWNHAYSIAFEVISDHEEEATFEEWMAGLRARVAQDPDELREVYATEGPWDTYEMEENAPVTTPD